MKCLFFFSFVRQILGESESLTKTVEEMEVLSHQMFFNSLNCHASKLLDKVIKYFFTLSSKTRYRFNFTIWGGGDYHLLGTRKSGNDLWPSILFYLINYIFSLFCSIIFTQASHAKLYQSVNILELPLLSYLSKNSWGTLFTPVIGNIFCFSFHFKCKNYLLWLLDFWNLQFL